MLLGLNAIRLSFSSHPLTLTPGLLALYQGFQILITGLTSSIVAIGLLAAASLIVALIGAYILSLHQSVDDL